MKAIQWLLRKLAFIPRWRYEVYETSGGEKMYVRRSLIFGVATKVHIYVDGNGTCNLPADTTIDSLTLSGGTLNYVGNILTGPGDITLID